MKVFQNRMWILLIPIVMLLLSACSLGSDTGYGDMLQQNADVIMSGIQNKNYTEIKETFSPHAKETYPQLEDEIAELMKFIDGEIESYDSVVRTSTGGTSKDGEWIKRSVKGVIENIKTDTGRTYTLEFEGYANNKEKPNLIGVRCILIISHDEKDEDGYPIEKSIFFE